MTNTQTIPAEVLDDLHAAEEFEAAAMEAVEITQLTLDRRNAELVEATEANERAANSYYAACRALDLAQQKLRSLRRAEGVVRTADGYQLVKTP